MSCSFSVTQLSVPPSSVGGSLPFDTTTH